MYNEDLLKIPENEDELWELLQEQFYAIRHDLSETAVEGEDEALGVVDDEDAREKRQLKSISAVIPYRGTSYEMDNRDYFLGMGCSLLPEIEQALKVKRLTPRFVQQWGKLEFCHGFIVSYLLDDSDPLANKRGGVKTGKKRSRDVQRKWLAHIIVPLVDMGKTRSEAESVAVEKVEEALAEEGLRGDFPMEWFLPIVTQGYLAATYDNKHFSMKQMRQLVDEPTNDIPPIPKIP